MAERAAKQLELNKSELPNSITEVIATLTRAGFDAYIVGGGVRDTLLGLRPKDFDAVTNAKPHEIKDVFGKRCRIIGRRFQLAHVYSGRELIEVATFRGPPTSDTNTNRDGMILRDNVWGDIKQDFARRDFSINALYYQPLKGVVHDFCGALEDIDNKIIRLLGHAPVRIEEDPVRLLRALRFKAKLGFEFDEALAEQFHDDNWALLEQISPHRLYDETQKMFTGGYLIPLLPLLFESGAIDSLMVYPPSEPSALVTQVAINTDKRIAAGKSINPAFFYAALLWENYLHQLAKAKKRNMPFAEAQMHAAGKVIERQRIKTAIPKFAEQFIRDIWILQPKLAAPRSKHIVQLSEHPRFRAGFDFLLLREQCGDAAHPLSESTNGMGDWWQTYQTLSQAEQEDAIDAFDENIRRGAYKKEQRGRVRQRQKPATQTSDKAPLHSDNAKQSTPHKSVAQGGNEQAMVNDSSNIPPRRRRAAGHAAPQKTPNPGTQQTEQDRYELAQLQQLSLSQGAQTRHDTKPAPLFVIEHKRVVPPLQKQLPETDTPPRHAERSKAKDSAQPPEVTKSSTDRSVNKAQAAVRRTIAKSPALVTINNEPIPYKRRRRLPTVDNSAVTTAAGTEPTPKKYPKKAPKPAAQPTGKSKKPAKVTEAKPTKRSQDTDNNPLAGHVSDHKMGGNKGPIPSKRRRRQPSTDHV